MKLHLRSEKKHHPELRRYCYCDSGGGDAPAPDPLVGQAMQTMADTGQQVANYQMGLTEQFRPYYESLLRQNVEAGDTATQRADSEWGMYSTYGVPMQRISLLLDAVDPTGSLSERERAELLAQFTGAERDAAARERDAGMRRIAASDAATAERDRRSAAIDRDALRRELLPQYTQAGTGSPQPFYADGQWWYPSAHNTGQKPPAGLFTNNKLWHSAPNGGGMSWYRGEVPESAWGGSGKVDEEGLQRAIDARVASMLGGGGSTTGAGLTAEDLDANYADRVANLGLSSALSTAIDTASRRASEAAGTRAGAETTRQHDLTQQTTERNMSRMGVNPGSTAAAFMSRGAGLRRAADVAGATNAARTNANLAGLSSRSNSVNAARGYPSTTLSMEGLSQTNRNAAVNTMGAQQTTSIAGQNAALPWYQSTAQTGLGLQSAAMQGYLADQQSQSSSMGALGQLAGLGASYLFRSSKKLKKNKHPIEDAEVLEEVKRLPVEKWDYKAGVADGDTHIGPYAEDVRKAFGDRVAPGGAGLDVVNMVGVTVSAVKGLARQVDRLAGKVDGLESRMGRAS